MRGREKAFEVEEVVWDLIREIAVEGLCGDLRRGRVVLDLLVRARLLDDETLFLEARPHNLDILGVWGTSSTGLAIERK